MGAPKRGSPNPSRKWGNWRKRPVRGEPVNEGSPEPRIYGKRTRPTVGQRAKPVKNKPEKSVARPFRQNARGKQTEDDLPEYADSIHPDAKTKPSSTFGSYVKRFFLGEPDPKKINLIKASQEPEFPQITGKSIDELKGLSAKVKFDWERFRDEKKIRPPILRPEEVEEIIRLKKRLGRIQEIQQEISILMKELKIGIISKKRYGKMRSTRERISFLERLGRFVNLKKHEPLTSGTFRIFRIMKPTDRPKYKKEVFRLSDERDRLLDFLKGDLRQKNIREILWKLELGGK